MWFKVKEFFSDYMDSEDSPEDISNDFLDFISEFYLPYVVQSQIETIVYDAVDKTKTGISFIKKVRPKLKKVLVEHHMDIPFPTENDDSDFNLEEWLDVNGQ